MFQLRPSTGLAARRPAERQSNPPASQTSTASSVRSSACLRSNTSRRSRTRRPRARAPRPVRAEGRRCSESWSTTTWTWTRSWTCLTSSPPPPPLKRAFSRRSAGPTSGSPSRRIRTVSGLRALMHPSRTHLCPTAVRAPSLSRRGRTSPGERLEKPTRRTRRRRTS